MEEDNKKTLWATADKYTYCAVENYAVKKGYRVIRFTNQEVLTDLESVMSKLINSLIE